MHGLTPVHNDSIYLPDGRLLNIREAQAARAVEEYDAGLILGQLHGRWTVFVRNGPIEGNPFPVFELGDVGEELPTPEEIKRRLNRADTKRHGGEIAARVDRVNREKQKAARQRADQAATETADHMDWGHRKLSGDTSRIVVPSK